MRWISVSERLIPDVVGVPACARTSAPRGSTSGVELTEAAGRVDVNGEGKRKGDVEQ